VNGGFAALNLRHECPLRADQRLMLHPETVIGTEFNMLILQGLANMR
jgi:hypothetical protein